MSLTKKLKHISPLITLKRVFYGTNSRFYLKGYELIIYESNIDYLSNHRDLMNKGFFRFNQSNYKNYLELNYLNYKENLSNRPLLIIDNFYNQLSIQYKINIGTFENPYHVIE